MAAKIRIDVSQMSAAEMQPLCRTIIAAAEEFYRDPKNVEYYNKWKAERQKKQKSKNR